MVRRCASLSRQSHDTVPPGRVDMESVILKLIKTKKEMGISASDIKKDTKLITKQTILDNKVVKKALASLLAKELIKEVANIKNKRNKHYMGAEFEPCEEISGGVWYSDGKLDARLIDAVKMLCLRCIKSQKVATLEVIYNDVKKTDALKFDITSKDVGDILNLMVFGNEIIDVKSTGLGDYYSIRKGTICYRVASGAGVARGPKIGAFASIPCGTCPRIGLCAPDGIVSPSNCVYYTKWLNMDF